eukprot:TRINITY_DN50833_c0_g1_i1.p1 TRINITY_DN50833_c0_g1~~TRINITY_DN50833_c0_g1_i1.p1  ORF type:complete len:100 (+),score=2.05 TRINITY_DN50833_c0_g1_i1:268-567(+)
MAIKPLKCISLSQGPLQNCNNTLSTINMIKKCFVMRSTPCSGCKGLLVKSSKFHMKSKVEEKRVEVSWDFKTNFTLLCVFSSNNQVAMEQFFYIFPLAK